MEMERVKREYTIVHTDTLRSTYIGYRVGQVSHSNEQPANSPIYIIAYLPTILNKCPAWPARTPSLLLSPSICSKRTEKATPVDLQPPTRRHTALPALINGW